MKHLRIFSFIFLLISKTSFGQHKVALRLGMNRFDLQLGVEYGFHLKQFLFVSSFDIGVNRTIFQQRFFPKIAIGVGYDLIKHEKWWLGPQITTGAYMLDFNKQLGRPTYWCEMLSGFRIQYGNQWNFFALGQIGPVKQWDYSLNEENYLKTFFVNFEYSIGCAYTF